MKIRACDLYYDSEASYRAVSRQLGIAPYRIFRTINALGANCKSTVDVASELKPRGVISDLLPEFFGTVCWLLPGIPHQFCTYHAYRATEFYLKYHYTGGNRLWAENSFLLPGSSVGVRLRLPL